MGGDHGPKVTVAAALAFANRVPDAEMILVGREPLVRAELGKLGAANHPRLSVVHAEEVVEMDDSLEVALRRKKDSSMRVAVTMVKDGAAQACVSAGNTAALMAVSRYVLKRSPASIAPLSARYCPTRKTAPRTCSIWAPMLTASLCICISLR